MTVVESKKTETLDLKLVINIAGKIKLMNPKKIWTNEWLFSIEYIIIAETSSEATIPIIKLNLFFITFCSLILFS